MFTIINRTRVLIAALALSARNRPPGRVESPKAGETSAARPRAGSPEFGVLIIIGVVAFIIVVAWLISRIGDDSGPRDDRSLV